jgi:hypothetical protein
MSSSSTSNNVSTITSADLDADAQPWAPPAGAGTTAGAAGTSAAAGRAPAPPGAGTNTDAAEFHPSPEWTDISANTDLDYAQQRKKQEQRFAQQWRDQEQWFLERWQRFTIAKQFKEQDLAQRYFGNDLQRQQQLCQQQQCILWQDILAQRQQQQIQLHAQQEQESKQLMILFTRRQHQEQQEQQEQQHLIREHQNHQEEDEDNEPQFDASAGGNGSAGGSAAGNLNPSYCALLMRRTNPITAVGRTRTPLGPDWKTEYCVTYTTNRTVKCEYADRNRLQHYCPYAHSEEALREHMRRYVAMKLNRYLIEHYGDQSYAMMDEGIFVSFVRDIYHANNIMNCCLLEGVSWGQTEEGEENPSQAMLSSIANGIMYSDETLQAFFKEFPQLFQIEEQLPVSHTRIFPFYKTRLGREHKERRRRYTLTYTPFCLPSHNLGFQGEGAYAGQHVTVEQFFLADDEFNEAKAMIIAHIRKVQDNMVNHVSGEWGTMVHMAGGEFYSGMSHEQRWRKEDQENTHEKNYRINKSQRTSHKKIADFRDRQMRWSQAEASSAVSEAEKSKLQNNFREFRSPSGLCAGYMGRERSTPAVLVACPAIGWLRSRLCHLPDCRLIECKSLSEDGDTKSMAKHLESVLNLNRTALYSQQNFACHMSGRGELDLYCNILEHEFPDGCISGGGYFSLIPGFGKDRKNLFLPEDKDSSWLPGPKFQSQVEMQEFNILDREISCLKQVLGNFNSAPPPEGIPQWVTSVAEAVEKHPPEGDRSETAERARWKKISDEVEGEHDLRDCMEIYAQSLTKRKMEIKALHERRAQHLRQMYPGGTKRKTHAAGINPKGAPTRGSKSPRVGKATSSGSGAASVY